MPSAGGSQDPENQDRTASLRVKVILSISYILAEDEGNGQSDSPVKTI